MSLSLRPCSLRHVEIAKLGDGAIPSVTPWMSTGTTATFAVNKRQVVVFSRSAVFPIKIKTNKCSHSAASFCYILFCPLVSPFVSPTLGKSSSWLSFVFQPPLQSILELQHLQSDQLHGWCLPNVPCYPGGASSGTAVVCLAGADHHNRLHFTLACSAEGQENALHISSLIGARGRY